MARVTRTGYIALLTLDGKEYDISVAEGNFGLNSIPSATCALAVGRNLRTLQEAAVHADQSKFVSMLPAKITLIPTGDWAQRGDGLWDKAGPQTVFDGYLTGGAFHVVRGQMYFQVQLIHWLSDMAFSSALSSESHPSNAPMQSWLAVGQGAHVTGVAGNPGTPGGLPTFLNQTVGFPVFNATNVTADLWGKCISVVLDSLCRQGSFIGPHFGCNVDISDNQAALTALARIDRSATGTVNRVKSSSFAVPLSFKLCDPLSSLSALAISDWFGRMYTESFWHSTMWDKLVGEIGPNLMFHIVPRVNGAIIAPFTPGLRTPWRISLGSNEIKGLDNSVFIPRPLRAAAITSPLTSQTGFYNATQKNGVNPPTVDNQTGGCFVPSDKRRGMLLLQQASGWLAGVPALTPIFKLTSQSKSATTPGFKAPVSTITALDGLTGCSDIFDQLAHAMYIQEILRNRTSSFQSKLRFDIAPGTTLKLDKMGGQVSADDVAGQDLFGSVIRTSWHLSTAGERPSAGTTFQLADLRTEQENESDATSTDSHPLYEHVFTGSPLVDAYLF